MPKTTCQSSIKYKKALQITIIFLFYGVVSNHTLSTYITYEIQITTFSWKVGIIIVKLESGNLYEVVGGNLTVDFNGFYNCSVHYLKPQNNERGEPDLNDILEK